MGSSPSCATFVRVSFALVMSSYRPIFRSFWRKKRNGIIRDGVKIMAKAFSLFLLRFRFDSFVRQQDDDSRLIVAATIIPVI